MTKQEFVKKLWVELKQGGDVQSIVNQINTVKSDGKSLTAEEQLEIVELIRQEHIRQTAGLFESVEAFLALVNTVEKTIKSQCKSDGNITANEGKNNENK